MPPLTAGIITAAKAVGILGKSAFDTGSDNNSDTPKAKNSSLITTEEEDVTNAT